MARACLLSTALGFFTTQAVQAQTSPNLALTGLNEPSHMTPRALSGLLTSVTRAGVRLVAVGERGRIVLSDDNGATWRQVETPTGVTLTHVTFLNATNGWATGGMGIVLHTADAGQTWTKQLDGVLAAKIALAAADADLKQSGANATTTANQQAAQMMVGGGPSVPFLDAYAAPPNNIMVAGAFGMAFASTDGGGTWQSQADFLPNPNGLHIYQILQDSGNFAVAGEQGLLLYGPPGRPLATITSSFQGTLFGETFTADHAWIVFGLQGTIMRSTDQGAHWAMVSAGQPVGIDCGITLADHAVLLGNEAGQLLYSHDGGRTFTSNMVNEPVVGLTQAADGSIIAVGPAGPRRITLASLSAGT